MKRRLLVFAVFVCLLCRVSSVFVQQYSGRQEVGDWATKDATHAGPLLPAHFHDLHYLPLWSAGMCALCCRSCMRKLRRRWSWRSSCGLCGDHTLRWLAHSCSSSGLHTVHMVNMVHMVDIHNVNMVNTHYTGVNMHGEHAVHILSTHCTWRIHSAHSEHKV